MKRVFILIIVCFCLNGCKSRKVEISPILTDTLCIHPSYIVLGNTVGNKIKIGEGKTINPPIDGDSIIIADSLAERWLIKFKQ